MTLAGAAAAAIGALLVAAILFGLVTVVGRLARRARARAPGAAGRAGPPAAACGSPPATTTETLIDQLVAVDARTWRAVEPTAVAMLGKVRGEAHTALVTVFERRGAGTRAERDLHARSPVVRARAAEVLGNLGPPDDVRQLCRAAARPGPRRARGGRAGARPHRATRAPPARCSPRRSARARCRPSSSRTR